MTPTEPPVTVARDLSRAQAEILRGLLEGEGLTVMLSQEAAGSLYAVDVGAFGQVELLVPAGQAERARAILDEIAGHPPDSDGG
ncbi:MAG TPA: DUF2007 domain-containing protein [Anaerolineales bacterium]|nr:DUF2007 domain-containing protein [Anaerolineales bacterium]